MTLRQSAPPPPSVRPSAGAPRPPALLSLVRALLPVVAVLAVIVGLAYAVNGATQGPMPAKVPVTVAADRTADLEVPGASPEVRVVVESPREATLTSSYGASRWDKFLSRGDWAVGGLAVGLGALLVRQLLDALTAGRTAPAVAALRRLALLVVVAWVLGPSLTTAAARSTLARMGLAEGQPFTPGHPGTWWPLAAAGCLVLLAQALRGGRRLGRGPADPWARADAGRT